MKVVKNIALVIVLIVGTMLAGGVGKYMANYAADRVAQREWEEWEADKPRITGFQSLQFGEGLAEVMKTHHVEFRSEYTWPTGVTETVYEVELNEVESHQIHGVPIVVPLRVSFNDNKLNLIALDLPYSEENYQKLKTGFSRAYGEPAQDNLQEHIEDRFDKMEKDYEIESLPITFKEALSWYGNGGSVGLYYCNIEGMNEIMVIFSYNKRPRSFSD